MIPRSSRGFYFTLDAMFGAFIIIAAVVLYLSFSHSDQDPTPLQNTATDAIHILNTLTLAEINLSNSTLYSQVIATNVTNESDSVLRTLGVLWATNNSLAPIFTSYVLQTFLPQYSYAVYAEVDKLASVEYVPQSQASRIASAKQQVSGIAFNRPITGTTATAFLKKIENKSTSSYVFFGGFVGQGNLSFALLNLPADISTTTIRDVTLEVDTPAQFTLLINGTDCGTFTPVGSGNASVNRWVVNTCHDQFTPGANHVEIRFNDSIDLSYLSGGFLQLRYVTNFETEDPYATPQTVPLPGINGIVNLYDSFFVPGNISSMEIRLHYLADHSGALANNPFYLTIANKTVYRENFSNSTQTITLADVNLTSILNYSQLSQQTIPFRIGFENLSFSTSYTGNADVALVTDVSGSMDWRMDLNNVNGVVRDCNNLQINNSDTQRLSVARCLDAQFGQDILNVSGNKLALVSYDSATNIPETVALTTNSTLINSTIASYVPGGSTCICCGINSATAELNRSIARTSLISAGATGWRFIEVLGSTIAPANDSSGNPWYASTYANETTWSLGQAVLGSNDNGTGPAIVTLMNNSIGSLLQTPGLWDMSLDNATPQIDFTSGLNSTANTFGVGGADDGWDWQGGVYGWGNAVAFVGVQGGMATIYTNTTANTNNCNNNDCSGGYGILVNITPALWSTLNANGYARLSFYYQWDSNPGNTFENDNNDDIMIKARWTNSSGSVTYFGTDLSNAGGDSTPEVDRRSNPDSDFSGTFATDITSLITGPGLYYFDAGVKLQADSNNGDNEWGIFRLDDVLIGITNQSDTYYMRKSFNVNNMSAVQTALLNILSDDRTTVYLNGQLVLDESLAHSAQYWNVHGHFVQSYLVSGTNVLAVRLENLKDAAKFDARIDGLNLSRNLAMLVMSDGQANVQCAQQGTGNADNDVIQAACDAREDWGITVHSVGFSDAADNATLNSAAQCAGGLFTGSANTTELADFYRNVALNILDASVKSQSIILNSSFQPSILYNDSYIRFVHSPAYPALRTNEITVKSQSPQFGSCTPSVYLNPTARVLAAQLTSYSGDHWTDLVIANGNVVYNLSSYTTPYIALGDPYIVHLPPNVLIPSSNSLSIRTGDSPTNSTGCSLNNSLITTLGIQLSTAYTPVLSQAAGCLWTIEHDDLTTQVIAVPKTYAGGNTCSYTNSSISYNGNDAYDVGAYGLLRSLDHDYDGRIFISLAEEDIEIIVNTVSNVPYLWGPSLFEVRVWQ